MAEGGDEGLSNRGRRHEYEARKQVANKVTCCTDKQNSYFSTLAPFRPCL